MNDDLVTLEAALYAAGRPLSLQELAAIIDKAESTTLKLLRELSFDYEQRGGALEVVELPRDRFVMQLRAELTPRVSKLIPGGLLSYATLQTLVFIALKQPILQSDLVDLRGTHVYEHVRELEEKKFIESRPEKRSKVLTTTQLFADYFGLDPDMIRLKAQLKHKLRQMLEETKEDEPDASFP
ncbi:MAG: SMC-Scp complex subunit ScpB [Candidatus Thorarchaeota archaeon]